MDLTRLVLLIAIAIVLLSTACNKAHGGASKTVTGTTSASPDEFTASRASFAKHCVSCHGENGDGGTVTSEGKKLKVPSLRTGHALNHQDKEFVDQITKGGDGMPAFADKLSAAEINQMVRFIRKEFQGVNPPAKTN